MLVLLLIRTFRPLALLRRLLVAGAAAGVGFLLLSALSHAVARPERAAEAAVRLLWCAVPLAATVQFAVAAARIDPCARPRAGLEAVGLEPARLPLLAAAATALSCALGSAAALAAFSHLRGDLGGMPAAGAAADLLDAGPPLPWAAALTLLAAAPLAAAAASAVALRVGDESPRPVAHRPPPVPTELPQGVALVALGLVLEASTADPEAPLAPSGLLAPLLPPAAPENLELPLPGPMGGLSPGAAAGLLLVAAGLVLVGPGLVRLCGLLLSAGSPGVLRLLAGRVLLEEAPRAGRPLGLLCAVATGTLVAVRLYGSVPEGGREAGPLTLLGAAVVLVCAAASALSAAAEFRAARAAANAGLLRLGASRGLLRAAAAVRTAVLLAAAAALVWVLATLAALPLVR